MLYFLNPIWLAAAAGIIVPVIIHLWNIRQGKVLRIGSTLLLSEATQKSSNSLKISQWLLLAIRSLLIIILAALLAGPQWKTNTTNNRKGWVLVNKDDLSIVYPEYKPVIDSLLRSGFELHDFNTGFDPLSLADSSVISRDSIAETGSPWQLISRLDTKLPAGYPVYIFSVPVLTNQVSATNGSGGYSRPSVSIDLHWNSTSTDRTIRSTLSEPLYTRQQPDGTLRTLLMHSNDTATWFTNSVGGITDTDHPADTSTWRITIFQEKNPADAHYLESAIRAVASFSKQKFSLITTGNAGTIPGNQDWLFWLSENEPPATVTGLAKNILKYASGTAGTIATGSWITMGNGPVQEDPVRTFKMLTVSAGVGDSLVWQDAFGNMLLAKQRSPANTWQLYTRFNPGWSDLNWDPGFPKMIAGLILKNDSATTIDRLDKRVVPNTEALPAYVLQSYKEQQSGFGSMDLEKLCWILAFLLLTSERILSLKQKTAGRI